MAKNCEWRERMQEMLDGTASEQDRARFLSHLRSCEACSKEWKAWLELRKTWREPAVRDWDPTPLRSRLFAAEAPVSRRVWVPAFGVAGLVALLVLLALWPAPPQALDPGEAERPIRVPGRERPEPAFLPEPVLVTWFSGMQELPLSAEAGHLKLGSAGRVRVAEEGEAALRLGANISLCAFSRTSAKIEQQAGSWTVGLERGRILVRLRERRERRFSVHVPAGSITALGTVFSVEQLEAGAARVNLSEGRLELRAACGQVFELRAPAAATLKSCALEDLSVPGLAALALAERAARLDPMQSGSLAWARIDSEPARAEVFSSGERLGRTPLWVARVEGRWEVELRQTGHYRKIGRLEFKPGQLQQRTWRLEPVSPAVADPPKPPPDLLAEARSLLARRRIPEARDLLSRHLAGQPGDWQARLLVADAARLAGDLRGAAGAYLKIAREEAAPEHVVEAALFETGRLQLHELDQPAAALRTFEALRRAHPAGLLRQEVAFGLAESYLALKEYSRAVRALEDYLRLYPSGTLAEQAQSLLVELESKGWR